MDDAPMIVKVKPLVWVEDGPHWPNCFHAVSSVGRYEIGPYNKGLFSCHVELQMRDIGLSFRSPDEAKSAAQADYEARIRAALDLTPDPRVAVLVEAAEYALRAADHLRETPHYPCDDVYMMVKETAAVKSLSDARAVLAAFAALDLTPDPRVAALVEACMAWGMHIAPEDATAADPFRDIRAALAAFKGDAQ